MFACAAWLLAVYTDLIISTIVDIYSSFAFHSVVYTDLIISTIVDRKERAQTTRGLYGLDNFYYRRSLLSHSPAVLRVYTDLIISTIVDFMWNAPHVYCLYGLDNFYYRRFFDAPFSSKPVYTDLIISTIVDSSLIDTFIMSRLYGLDNFYYRRLSTLIERR